MARKISNFTASYWLFGILHTSLHGKLKKRSSIDLKIHISKVFNSVPLRTMGFLAKIHRYVLTRSVNSKMCIEQSL